MTDELNMATITLKGQKFNIIINPKNFSTGSVGFYGQGKIEIDGKRYQTNIQLVEIGSKPKDEKTK